VLAHQLKLFASRFTAGDAHLMPTGEIAPLPGRRWTSGSPRRLATGINSGDEQIRLAHGYDHNFVIDEQGAKLKQAGGDVRAGHWACDGSLDHRARDPFYTGNFLDGTFKGKNGVAYGKRDGSAWKRSTIPILPITRNSPRPYWPGQSSIANDLPFSTR